MQCKVDTHIDRAREGSVDLSAEINAALRGGRCSKKHVLATQRFVLFVPSLYPYGQLFPSRESRLISLGEIGRVGVRHRRVRSLGYRRDKLDLSRTVGVEATGRIQTIFVAFPTIHLVTFLLLVSIKSSVNIQVCVSLAFPLQGALLSRNHVRLVVWHW